MKLTSVIALAASLVSPTLAFSNSSPHVILSSVASLDSGLGLGAQKALSAKDFDSVVNEAVSGCPADTYVFVSQPGLHSSDLEDPQLTPFLHRIVGHAKSSFVFNHVFSDTERAVPREALQHLEQGCGVAEVQVDGSTGKFERYVDTKPRMLLVDLDELSADLSHEQREATLRANDDVLKAVLGHLPSPNYVLVYISSPTLQEEEDSTYQMVQQQTREESSSQEQPAKDNVFAKYQFFTPGILMTTIISLLLVVVMLVALKWIGSLQISYGAFEKDPELVRQKKHN